MGVYFEKTKQTCKITHILHAKSVSCTKATVFAHTSSVVEGTETQSTHSAFRVPFRLRACEQTEWVHPAPIPSNQPLIAKAVISSISDNHMVHHPDIE